MPKPKTKLVSRGWVIDRPEERRLWCPPHGLNTWPTRAEAITAYNRHYGSGFYRQMQRLGLAIVKKLWVEVKDESS